MRRFIELQRNGRIWKRIGSDETEEVLDVLIKGKKLGRGLCLTHYQKALGVKFKEGEAKIFEIREVVKNPCNHHHYENDRKTSYTKEV